MHILINRTSWNIILDNIIHFLTASSFSWGDTPPRPTATSLYSHSLLVKFKVLLLPPYWFILRPLYLLGQGPRFDIYLGLRPHCGYYFHQWSNLILNSMSFFLLRNQKKIITFKFKIKCGFIYLLFYIYIYIYHHIFFLLLSNFFLEEGKRNFVLD